MISHLHHQLFAGRIPSYVFTKNLKTKYDNEKKKDFLSTIPKQAKMLYAKGKGIEYKSIEDLYKFYPEETEAELKEIKDILEQKTKKRKSKKLT